MALVECAALSEKTRSIIVATLTGMLDTVSRGVAQKLLATDTTLSLPDVFREGKIVLVDLEYSTWGTTGKFVYSALKHLVCIEALRRDITPQSKLVWICADEAQNIVVDQDSLYASVSRSARAPLLYCTQGFESFFGTMAGENNKAKAQTLIGNLVLKLFCCPTPDTAELLCQGLGRKRIFLSNASTQGSYETPMDLWGNGPSRASAGVSESFESMIHPHELARMRTGSAINAFMVDCLVVQSGRTFDNGFSFTPTAFRQRS